MKHDKINIDTIIDRNLIAAARMEKALEAGYTQRDTSYTEELVAELRQVAAWLQELKELRAMVNGEEVAK